MAAGFAAPLFANQLTPVAWTWNVALGAAATVAMVAMGEWVRRR
jgi:hypothetical protein